LKIAYFSVIQQDTLIMPLLRQNQSLPEINVRKTLLDLERAEEIIRRFEQREQEIIQQQQPVVKPRPKPVEPVELPSIVIDSLLQVDSLHTAIPVETHGPTGTGFFNEARQIVNPSSVTFFIIFGWVLLTFLMYQFGKNLMEAFLSFFSYRRAVRKFEERRESDKQASFLSNVLFIWISGIFVTLALPFFGVDPLWGSYTLSMLFFSTVIGLLYITKALLWNILGVIFMVQPFSKTYIFNMFLYNQNIGLIIFPLVTMIPYITGVLLSCIVFSVMMVFALSFIFKYLRIFQIIHGLNVPMLYFILYLCTLEILPLLVFLKGCKILWEFNLF